jgi:hypothetical protein
MIETVDKEYKRKTLCERCKQAIVLTLNDGIQTGETSGSEECLCGKFDLPRYICISPFNLANYLRSFTAIT